MNEYVLEVELNKSKRQVRCNCVQYISWACQPLKVYMVHIHESIHLNSFIHDDEVGMNVSLEL
jgi:hypothetical protein